MIRRAPPPTPSVMSDIGDPPSINPHSAGSWLAGGRGAAANIAIASRAAGGNDGARLGALYYKNGEVVSCFFVFRATGVSYRLRSIWRLTTIDDGRSVMTPNPPREGDAALAPVMC